MGGGAGDQKRIHTLRWLLVVGLAGVFIVLLNSFLTAESVGSLNMNGSGEGGQKAASLATPVQSELKPSLFEDIELQYESRLKEVLEKTVGVGLVEVMVNVDSTEEIIVYKNTRETSQVTNEKDSGGGVRRITEMTRDGEILLHEVSGNEEPVIVKTLKPKIRGVVVIAAGAENPVVKKMIMDAVMRGLNVKSVQVAVLPHKQK